MKSLSYMSAMRDKPIHSGDELDYDTLCKIALHAYQSKDIKEIFATNNGQPCSYYTLAYCEACEDSGYRDVNKKQLIDFMVDVRENYKEIPTELGVRPIPKVPSCRICIEKIKQEKEAITSSLRFSCSKENQTHLEKRIAENTKKLITVYLNSEYASTDLSKMRKFASDMDRCFYACDEEAFCKAAKEMNYKAFLKTLYWKICAYRARKKSGFRCAMCGASEKLNVHHSTYEFHGREHTTEGRKSLTCVCQSCHAKHHDK